MATTPTSGPGSRYRPRAGRPAAPGFTLIELLVVLAVVAIASGVVTLALRDPAASALDREAVRLAALLDAARAESRTMGVAGRFEVMEAAREQAASGGDPAATAAPYRFVGLPEAGRAPARWLEPAVSAEVVGARAVLLGPEPILPAQRIVLRLGDRRRVVASDGLGPFVPVGDDGTATR
jgi:general secretion pathway protein H